MSAITPDLVSQYASKWGVPLPLAMGIFGQESGMGSASPNIGQITNGTAANPGYGMAPLSQSDLNDPNKNIDFSLGYFKNKAAALGFTNLSDPAQAAGALQAYNGGGDPNYVQNVANKMGPSGAPMASVAPMASSGGAPVAPGATMTPQPLPPMPPSFGQAPAGSSAAPQVDQSGHQGDPLVAMGMAMMGGNGWHDAMAKGGEAYATAQAQQLGVAKVNAGLQNDAANRDAIAPEQAAQTANLRAQGWKALNPQAISPLDAATFNEGVRRDNITQSDALARNATGLEEAKTRAQYMTQMQADRDSQNKSSQPYVDRGPDGVDPPQFYQMTMTKGGQTSILDSQGKTIPALPPSAEPMSAALHLPPDEMATVKSSVTARNAAAAAATTARDQDTRYTNAMAALQAPGANVTPGILGTLGRNLDAATGMNLTGNLSDEQIANAMLQQDMLGQFSKAGSGGQRVTDSLRSFITNAQPHLGQDPQAIVGLTKVLQQQNAPKFQVMDQFDALSAPQKQHIIHNTGFAPWADQQTKQLLASQKAAASAPGQPPANRPPLASFRTAPVAPQPGPQGAPPLADPMTGQTGNYQD